MNHVKIARLVPCAWCREAVRYYSLYRHLTKVCAHAPRCKIGEDFCTICQQVKSIEELYPNTHACKPCKIQQGRDWRIANAGIVRTETPKLRPGGWVLRPCPHCGEGFNHKQLLKHRARCKSRPAVIAGPRPSNAPDDSIRNMADLKKESLAGREDRSRSRLLKFQYGIDSAEYDRMFAAQCGKCAICGATDSGQNRGSGRLHVDHDHATGKVRGLLCHGCNHGLGKFRDSPALLMRALGYLAEYCSVAVVT